MSLAPRGGRGGIRGRGRGPPGRGPLFKYQDGPGNSDAGPQRAGVFSRLGSIYQPGGPQDNPRSSCEDPHDTPRASVFDRLQGGPGPLHSNSSLGGSSSSLGGPPERDLSRRGSGISRGLSSRLGSRVSSDLEPRGSEYGSLERSTSERQPPRDENRHAGSSGRKRLLSAVVVDGDVKTAGGSRAQQVRQHDACWCLS